MPDFHGMGAQAFDNFMEKREPLKDSERFQ